MAVNGTQKLLALDAMAFIYYLDASDETLHVRSRLTIEPILTGKTRGVTSIISLLETLSSPRYVHDTERVEHYSLFFQTVPSLQIVDVTWDIAQEAARLRRTCKSLRTPDALQLATALVSHADTFVTNDIRLKNLSLPGLTIRTLS
jgi:predicted nucleic acid-binding protein